VSSPKVLVTGGRSAIGAAVIDQALNEGSSIFATSSNCEHVESSQESGSSVDWLHWNPSDLSSIKNLVRDLGERTKELDGVVICGALPYGGLLTQTSISALREVFEYNFFSQIALIQEVWKLLRKSSTSPSVVFVSSTVTAHPMPGYGAYGSSKIAVEYCAQVLSQELKHFGIRFNSVLPGLTESPMMRSMDEKSRITFLQRTNSQRVATPSEIAKLICFLISPQSSYISGQSIHVDGGYF
jgi:3-oxoacyl-[acyl-carrier protein] reductase